MLLLDEPLSALDKKLREEMQLELKRLQAEVGITFLIVTHDQEEALVMADRVAVLNAGRLAQVGTPQELYEHPNSRFVAGFIGVMNFLDGTATPHGVEVPDAGLLRGANDASGAASIAVRPERVMLLDSDPKDGRNAVGGTIFDTAYHGSDLAVHVRVCDGRHVIVVRMQAGQFDPASIATGKQVYCVWDAAHSRVLAPA